MRFIFLIARLYPYWALPGALVLGELGLYFRRNRSGLQYPFWFISLVLLVGIVLWFFYRGDLHSDQWIRSFFQVS